MGVWYTTREQVKAALDIKLTARTDEQVDRAIESGSRIIDGAFHRKFYPEIATRVFDWPNFQFARPWRLWLEEDELIEVIELSSGGNVISSSDFFLEPANQGPPFISIELDLDSSASFGQGGTHQQDISIEGVFGHSADEAPAGALAEALDASETEVQISNSAIVDVGHILKVDDERMIVTDKAMIDTTFNIVSGVTNASTSDVTLEVTDGTQFFVGEVIEATSERMLIVSISGNDLTVKRGWDGTVLATPGASLANIFALRSLTVERGALGTTTATHLDEVSLTKHVVPGPINALALGLAIDQIQQEQSAYARTIGSGENAREMSGAGLASLWEKALTSHGRQMRIGAI